MKIIEAAYHPNAVFGAPFQVTVFNDGQGYQLAVIFAAKGHYAVLDFEKLLTGHIGAGEVTAGENCYRSDQFEARLREAVAAHLRAK
jgi:hypothetical protein